MQSRKPLAGWRFSPEKTSCAPTANAIAPGFFVTNIGGGHAHNPELQAALAKDIPMHRVGQPDDIKALALFLASPASGYITGQEIVIDGNHRLITDEPESVGGEGSAPAPHELLPAALAACVSTTIVMYARTKEWDVGEVAVDVEYDHRSTPRRVFTDS